MPTREVAVVLPQDLADVVLVQAAMVQVLHAVRSVASSMVRDAPQPIVALIRGEVLVLQPRIRRIRIAQTIVLLRLIPTRTPIVQTTAHTTRTEGIVNPLHLHVAAEVALAAVALAAEAWVAVAVLAAEV